MPDTTQDHEARGWTPGPWHIKHAGNQYGTGMVKAKHHHFANVYSCEVDHGNCQLIALAPEMAEAILGESRQHRAMILVGVDWEQCQCPVCMIADKLRQIGGSDDA